MNPNGMFVAVTRDDENLTEKTTSKSPSSAPPNPAINSRVKALASQISSFIIYPSRSGHEPVETVDEFVPYPCQDKRHSRNCDDDGKLVTEGD